MRQFEVLRSLQMSPSADNAKGAFCIHPCPCGCWATRPFGNCTCSPAMVTRYQKRISGPLLDRFDIHIEVPRVEYEKLASDRAGEPSEGVRQRVLSARARQHARFDGSGLMCNADMGPTHIREYCELDETSKALMRSAM